MASANKVQVSDKTSVRAKSLNSKIAFRTVLDNPSIINYSTTTTTTTTTLISHFLSTPINKDDLQINNWRSQLHSRKRLSSHHPKKKQKLAPTTPIPIPIPTHSITTRSDSTYSIPNYVDNPLPPLTTPTTPLPPLKRPQILDHLAIGINEVTKALESRILWSRLQLGESIPTLPLPTPTAATPSKKDSKKTRSLRRHLSRRNRKTTQSLIPAALQAPLNTLKPAHPTTLSRPSLKFLSSSASTTNLKISTRLPSYLLPPKEVLPFFSLLESERRKQVIEEDYKNDRAQSRWMATSSKRRKKLACAELLGGVMGLDDRLGERIKRVGTKHWVEKKVSEATKRVLKEESEKKKLEELEKGSKRKVLRTPVEVGVGGSDASDEEKDEDEVDASENNVKVMKRMTKKNKEKLVKVGKGEGSKRKRVTTSTENGDVEAQEGEGEEDEEKNAMDEDDPQQEESEEEESSAVTMIDIILVCKDDINPQSLVAHFPSMVATSNNLLQNILSSSPPPPPATNEETSTPISAEPKPLPILLLQLPKGSELILSNILGLRRVASIGISSKHPKALALYNSLSALTSSTSTTIKLPWIPSSSSDNPFIPTHIKHYKTTAPIDSKKSNTDKKEIRKVKKLVRQGEVYVGED